MAKTKNDNPQGTLALLVLKTLEQGPMHGWGITLHIQRRYVSTFSPGFYSQKECANWT